MTFLWLFMIFHVLFKILNNVLLHFIKKYSCFDEFFMIFYVWFQILNNVLLHFITKYLCFINDFDQFFSSYFTTKSWSDLILFCSNLFFNSLSKIYSSFSCLIQVIQVLFKFYSSVSCTSHTNYSAPYLAGVLGVPEHPRNLGVHKRGEAWFLLIRV